MTIFGNKNTFAVEYDPIAGGQVTIPECHFSYWIGGREVGNYSFDAPIVELVEDLRSVLCNSEFRRSKILSDVPTCDVVRTIKNYVRYGRDDLAIWDNLQRCSISYYMGHGYPPSQGNRFFIYEIEGDDAARIVVIDERDITLAFEHTVALGEVDIALRAAWNSMLQTIA